MGISVTLLIKELKLIKRIDSAIYYTATESLWGNIYSTVFQVLAEDRFTSV